MAVVALVALLAACGSDGGEDVRTDRSSADPAPPDRPADSVGPVSLLPPGSVRIDEATGVVGAVAARVDEATEVLRRRGDAYEAAALSDVAVGDRVEIWVDGPVAESFPAQAHAAVVLLVA